MFAVADVIKILAEREAAQLAESVGLECGYAEWLAAQPEHVRNLVGQFEYLVDELVDARR